MKSNKYQKLEKEKKEQELWEFFVFKNYNNAKKEVNSKMFKKYSKLGCFFRGKEQLIEINKLLNKWFNEIKEVKA